MVELKDIRVTFNKGTPLEKLALDDVSLSIGEDDFITIIGGNGAGKSTLMRVLSGEERVGAGSVTIDGEDVTSMKVHERAAFVSHVFQDPLVGTCADLTIEENMALALKRGEIRDLSLALNLYKQNQFRDVLAELEIGLEDRIQTPMGLLSGGQRQAVSLLMATLRPSRLILLDEHTAALDPKMAKLVMDLTVKLVNKHNLTALMITHQMSQALEYGNRTLVMQSGKVVEDFDYESRKSLTVSSLLDLFQL